MTHQVEATYELDGTLRLAHPLPLEDHQRVRVAVSAEVHPAGKWAAVCANSGAPLAYADTVKEARDRARTLGAGEPLIRWIAAEPELPSAGF